MTEFSEPFIPANYIAANWDVCAKDRFFQFAVKTQNWQLSQKPTFTTLINQAGIKWIGSYIARERF